MIQKGEEGGQLAFCPFVPFWCQTWPFLSRHCEGNPLSLFAFAREDEVEVIRIRATPCTLTCDVSGFWGETTPT